MYVPIYEGKERRKRRSDEYSAHRTCGIFHWSPLSLTLSPLSFISTSSNSRIFACTETKRNTRRREVCRVRGDETYLVAARAILDSGEKRSAASAEARESSLSAAVCSAALSVLPASSASIGTYSGRHCCCADGGCAHELPPIPCDERVLKIYYNLFIIKK